MGKAYLNLKKHITFHEKETDEHMEQLKKREEKSAQLLR